MENPISPYTPLNISSQYVPTCKCHRTVINQLIRFLSTPCSRTFQYIFIRRTLEWIRVKRTSSNFIRCKSYIFIISQGCAQYGTARRYPSTREAINCEGKHACQQVMYCSQRRESLLLRYVGVTRMSYGLMVFTLIKGPHDCLDRDEHIKWEGKDKDGTWIMHFGLTRIGSLCKWRI